MQVSKKVLYVFGGEQASGAEIVMERLINYNLDSIEPHIFISQGKFAENLMASGKPYTVTQVQELRKLNRSSAGKLQFYKQAVLNHFSVSGRILKYAKENKIDIVHAITVVPASYCIPAILQSKLFRKNILWVWSDYDIKHFAKLDHYFSALCSRVFNVTLAASNAVKNKYSPKPSVITLYNGLDTEIFKPDKNSRQVFRKQFDIDEQTIVFGIAGVISPRKGQLELIHAFSEAATNKNVQLILAGSQGKDDEEYNRQVIALAERLPFVKFIGHFSNMPAFLNGCDVLVNNSTAVGSEPLGTTIYEAMSCETIVLCSNTGGTPEIIDDGINGFLYAPDDQEALANAINKIIAGFSSLGSIKKAARKKVEETFNISQTITQYNSILEISA